jgi:hypothetical protein
MNKKRAIHTNDRKLYTYGYWETSASTLFLSKIELLQLKTNSKILLKKNFQ